MNEPMVNWRNPDYGAIIRARLENLDQIRAHPEDLPELRAYYKENPWDFISDWAWTFEPRNVEIGLPALIPFVLMPRQIELARWIIERWKGREPGAVEKARDCGATWVAVSLACTLCIFNHGTTIGFGSRKAEYVDKLGTMKPILPKGRIFMENLPEEFRAGFVPWRDAPSMRIGFPETGSLITGEGGDDIGRGDRTSIFFVDEAEHLGRPDLVEFSLSRTTNCRIDMSSVNGSANPIARKILEKRVEVFYFDWHDDLRKDDAWYAAECDRLDPVVVAQEIDRDRGASVHGIVIPGAWVRSAIDFQKWAGLGPSGEFTFALDIADEGRDKNAAVGGRGIEISLAEEWSGRGSDTFATVERAFDLAEEHGCRAWRYDADGMGALVRGDARVINERRAAQGLPAHAVVGFRGSEGVVDPEGVVEGTTGREGDPGRLNQDYFLNRKAQGWWSLRKRFQRTHRWRTENVRCHRDEVVSLDPKMPNLGKLTAELSQPTYGQNGVGKMLINKRPDGMPSPNLADGAMMRFAPMELPAITFTEEQVRQLYAAPRRRRY